VERKERSMNDKRKKEQGGMRKKGGREAVPPEETRREREGGGATARDWLDLWNRIAHKEHAVLKQKQVK
jgi:hypothetical protein